MSFVLRAVGLFAFRLFFRRRFLGRSEKPRCPWRRGTTRFRSGGTTRFRSGLLRFRGRFRRLDFLPFFRATPQRRERTQETTLLWGKEGSLRLFSGGRRFVRRSGRSFGLIVWFTFRHDHVTGGLRSAVGEIEADALVFESIMAETGCAGRLYFSISRKRAAKVTSKMPDSSALLD